MNFFITSFLSVFFVLHSILSIPFTEVEKAFADGNATQIVDHGTTKMLISIDGKEGVYSKSQGAQILGNFFKSNPPESFSFDFKGKEKGASSFAVGYYHSKQKFRVSIKFKNVSSKYLIESLTIVLVD